MMSKIWRAIYVNSRSEKKVAVYLSEKGIESYVPLIKTVRQWSDRKKVVELPLLSGYAFVRVSAADHDRVLFTPGVVAYVRSEGKPAEIRDEEIERLRQLVKLGYHIEARTGTDHFSKGDRVKIAAGPLQGMEGLVSDRGDETEICLILDSIHHSIIVRLPKGMLAAT